MATEKLQVIIEAKDDTASGLKSAQTGLQNLKSRIEDMKPVFKGMAVAGGLAFAAIGGVVKSSLEESTKAQAEMTVATQTLQNAFNNLTKNQVAKLKTELGTATVKFSQVTDAMKLAGSAALKLGFDDEAASSAFARLFQVTGNVAQANKEVAIAMDLARAKNISLQDATQKLIMVHSGSTKALKAEGLQIDENADALTNIDALARTFADTAVAYAGTGAGAMERLNESFSNVKQTIGDALAPALAKILDILQPIIDKFIAWAERNPELLAKIILIAGAVTGLVAAIGTLGLILPAIIAGFTLLLGPIGLIILGITAIAALAYVVINNWTKIKDFFINLWAAVVQIFTMQVNIIKQTIQAFLDGVKAIWESVWGSIKSFFQGIWNSIIGIVQSAVQKIKGFLEPILNMISKIVNGISQAAAFVGGKAKGAVNAVKDFFTGRASGGNVQPGRPFMVGEHGPETFVPTGYGRIIPNGGMGASVTINISGNSFMGREDIAESIGNDIIKILKANMKI